jgi:hypothetical protein
MISKSKFVQPFLSSQPSNGTETIKESEIKTEDTMQKISQPQASSGPTFDSNIYSNPEGLIKSQFSTSSLKSSSTLEIEDTRIGTKNETNKIQKSDDLQTNNPIRKHSAASFVPVSESSPCPVPCPLPVPAQLSANALNSVYLPLPVRTRLPTPATVPVHLSSPKVESLSVSDPWPVTQTSPFTASVTSTVPVPDLLPPSKTLQPTSVLLPVPSLLTATGALPVTSSSPIPDPSSRSAPRAVPASLSVESHNDCNFQNGSCISGLEEKAISVRKDLLDVNPALVPVQVKFIKNSNF